MKELNTTTQVNALIYFVVSVVAFLLFACSDSTTSIFVATTNMIIASIIAKKVLPTED